MMATVYPFNYNSSTQHHGVVGQIIALYKGFTLAGSVPFNLMMEADEAAETLL
jgi:hypothetical protein